MDNHYGLIKSAFEAWAEHVVTGRPIVAFPTPEAQTLEDDRAGDKSMTGDAITFEVMSRHHYHTQRHVATGHATSPVPEQPAELSVEQAEAFQKRNAELWQEVGKNEARIQQLEEELRNLPRSCPAAASRVSEGATATPFEVAVSRQERQEERQDFDSEFDVSPRLGKTLLTQMGWPHVVIRFGIFRINCQRLFVGLNRLFVLAKAQLHITQVVLITQAVWRQAGGQYISLSLIHISEPTRPY